MPTLEENVKAELLKRHTWSMTGMNGWVIPSDAFFNHVTPFINPTKLLRQDIVNILKTDERFVNLVSEADSEVNVFAEILYHVMNNAKPNNIWISAYCSSLALHIDLSQSNNLDDILSGKFSLALQPQNMNTVCCFFFMAISAGLFYGGIRGFQRSFEGRTTIGDVFIGGLSFGALMLAIGVFFCCADSLCQFVRNATQQVMQIELTAFYEKHGPSPLVSISTSEQQHSSEVPLLPISAASNARYGSIAM